MFEKANFKRYQSLAILFLSLLLILISLPVIYPYFKPQAINTYDTMYRLTRAAKYYVAAKQGQIPPRWIGDTYHGVGEPIFVYLYPFPYMITTLFYILDFSIIDAVKIPLILSFLGSALTMFFFLRAFHKPLASFIGTLLYIWAPYRMVQLYVRGAYEETMSYFFLPLLFLSIWWIYQGKEKMWIVGGTVLGLLLLTQSSISLMFLPSMATFMLLLIKKQKLLQLLKSYAMMIFLGFSLAAMTILPNLFERQYIQLDKKISPIYEKNFISLDRLWDSPWTMIPTPQMLGKAHILVLLLSVIFLFYYLWAKRDKNGRSSKEKLWFGLFILSLSWSIIPLILSIDSPLAHYIWQNILTVRVIYVPYLFLQLAIFWIAFLAAVFLDTLEKLRLFVAGLLVVVTVVTNISYIKPDYYFPIEDENLTAFNGSLSQFEEFLPKTAQKAKEQYAEGPIAQVNNQSAKIEILEKKYHRIKLQVKTPEDNILTIHQLFFPGWKAYIDNKTVAIGYTKPPINLETKKPIMDAGLITLPVSKGSHQILLTFGNTPVRLLGNIISLVTFLFIIMSALRGFLSKKV